MKPSTPSTALSSAFLRVSSTSVGRPATICSSDAVASGVGAGADTKLMVPVELSPAVTGKNLTRTVAKSLGVAADSKGFAVYIISKNPFSGLLVAKAFDRAGAEIGRSRAELEGMTVLEAAMGVVLGQAGLGEWRPFFANAHARTFRDKARLSLRRVFLSRAEMAATYPSARGAALLFPWYARRVGRVVRSYAVHSLRRARLLATSPERRNTAALVRWLSGTD